MSAHLFEHAPSELFLTAAGEYPPLAEVYLCHIVRFVRDDAENDCMVVRLHAYSDKRTQPQEYIEESLYVLSPGHQGINLKAIEEWPAHVGVSRLLKQTCLATGRLGRNQYDALALARLYENVNDAKRDADRHAAARKLVKAVDTMHVPEVRFLGPQVGEPEQRLQDACKSILESHETVWKAYLARVDYGPGTSVSVAMCLRTSMGVASPVAEKIAKVFAEQFRTTQQLDILFLSADQEAELAKVCVPFYVRSMRRRT